MSDDLKTLREMRSAAERLCATGDQLLAGQYQYLKSRIEALIEQHRAVEPVGGGAGR